MRYFSIAVFAIAVSGYAGAGSAAPAGLVAGEPSSVQLVQEKEKRKSDTVTERIKRAWKDLVGYKFDVSCPIIFPVTRSSCTETGKDRADARGKCASRNPFCYVTEASR
jgi:hypothetical protein